MKSMKDTKTKLLYVFYPFMLHGDKRTFYKGINVQQGILPNSTFDVERSMFDVQKP